MAMSKNRKKTTKTTTGKSGESKPHFFSPEAKAERFKKRMALVETHIESIKENNGLFGRDSEAFVDAKALKAADTMLRKLSLKDLELVKHLFINAEMAGYKMAEPVATSA